MGIIVIESGGTNSTWWYESSDGRIKQLQDIGFPPFAMNEQRVNRLNQLLNLPELIKTHSVYFFGAGCEHEKGKEIIKRFFYENGFNNIEVHSDLLGACIACHGNQSGVTGILGTGSVAAVYDGQKITQQHGGLGYLLGDEGSGFYLGRLLLKAYFTKELNPSINEAIENYFDSREAIIPSIYSDQGRMKVAGLSKIVHANQSNPEIKKILSENFTSYVTSTLLPINDLKHISFIGSIAYFFQTNLADVLQKYNIELVTCHQAASEYIFNYLRTQH